MTTVTLPGDRARVQTFVRVSIEAAFDVFTLELDAWWRQGPRYRVGGKHPGPLHLEPKLGGRIFEQYGKTGEAVHEIGRVTIWERPTHFAFTWRGINFKDADPDTFVDVTFAASGEGTRVTLVHAGFAALRDDHPVRHGKSAEAFMRDLGMFWGSLVTSMRERAEADLP